MSDVERLYSIDVREVVEHMRDKCYHDLGEAFESLFYMFFEINDAGEVIVLSFE